MASYLNSVLVILAASAYLGSLAGCSTALFAFPGVWFFPLLFCGLAWRFRQSSAAIGYLLLAVFCLYGCRGFQAAQLPLTDVSHLGDRRDVVCEGVIEGMLWKFPDARGWKGILSCQKIIWKNQQYPVTGKVRLNIFGTNEPLFSAGDQVRLRGCLREFENPMNPGEFNLKNWYRRQGVRMRFETDLSADCQVMRQAPWYSMKSCLADMHAGFIRILKQCTPEPGRKLVLAIVANDRTQMDALDKNLLSVTGLAHLVAISGSNIGLIYFMLFGLGRAARVPRRGAISIGLLGAWGYSLVVGMEPSVSRAIFMLGTIALFKLFSRQAEAWSGLGGTGMAMLWHDPVLCLDAGFQLSFAATAGILFVWPYLDSIRKHTAAPWFWLQASLALSLAAFLATAPLTVYHFYTLSPGAILGNLAAVPLLNAMMISAAGVMGVHCFWPGGAHLLGEVCSQSAQGIELTMRLVESIPGSKYYLWAAPPWWIGGYYLSGAGALLRSPIRKIGMAVWLAWLGIYPAFNPSTLADASMRLTFLSLNQGETTLIENGQGQRILIDTGTSQEFLWRVKPFLASRGIQRLDALLLSHMDDDHAGGLEAAARFFTIDKIFTASETRPKARSAKPGRGMKTTQYPSWIQMQQGMKVQLGPTLWLEALWPPSGRTQGRNPECLAVLVQADGRRALFTGDSRIAEEEQWPKIGHCQVFKAGHHGDQRANGDGLLSQIRPDLSIVTPGNHNRFGFPDPEALARLRIYSQTVLNTQQQGAVQIILGMPGPPRWVAGADLP